MKMKFALVPVLFLLALSACSSTEVSSGHAAANAKLEAQGLPFRWSAGEGGAAVMRLMPLPAGPTKADAKLAGEILAGIRKKEQANGRTDAMLQEVQQMKDGREVWLLQSLNGGIAYVVGLTTPIRVQGPYNYAK
jgi:hypothetical protein